MSRFWFEKPAVKYFDHENELCVVGNAVSATYREHSSTCPLHGTATP